MTELPRNDLVRAVPASYGVRQEGESSPVMFGRFTPIGEWTEINSSFEGHFLERFAPGAFDASLAERTPKVLFQHGRDNVVGDQVLGTPSFVRGDASYEVPLYEGIPPLILSGLRDGAYGASFRFSVDEEEVNRKPETSEHNPDGIMERTVTKARVFEFGPVTFPAYEGASAGVRSLTDWYADNGFDRRLEELATSQPRELAKRIEHALAGASSSAQATAESRSGGDRSAGTEKETTPMAVDIDRFSSLDLLVARKAEIGERQKYLNAEYAGKELPPEVQTEWDALIEEEAAITKRETHLRERQAVVDHIVTTQPATRVKVEDRKTFNTPDIDQRVRNIFDMAEYRQAARSPEDEAMLLRDGAKRAIDATDIPLKGVSREEGQEKANDTLNRLDRRGELAAYLLAVGSPTYRRAFGKFANAAPVAAAFSPEEANAVTQAQAYAERAFTLGSTGLPVPFQLDPTVIPISNWSVNPFRAISRVVQTTVNNWRGATSAGITAAYAAEGTEASDNTPTLAQPTIDAVRAQAFVPFSIEVSQDWSEVEAEMGREVADAKDDLEATKFTLGNGTNEPFGLITGATTTVATTTTGAFVIADLYKMEEALPPRFRPRASIIGNRFVLNKVRQFDTSGGSGVWLDVPGLSQSLDNQVPTPGNVRQRILGYPTYENSAMDAVLTTGSEILVMGDFRYFIIVDRVGMSADLIPHLVGTNHRPTGQRGLYFFWRNGSKVVNAAAFRTLTT
jgi:HK97 family phage major capsid protein